MTDMLKGSQVLQKTYTYIENVTKESRKALMEEFSQKHKGIAINSAKVPSSGPPIQRSAPGTSSLGPQPSPG